MIKEEDAANPQRARERALGLLARREHSCRELTRKLRSKGFEAAAIDETIERLVADELLSEERFTESYVRVRIDRGFGPARIRAELRERGIGPELAERHLDYDTNFWMEQLLELNGRKYAGALIESDKERAKRLRFFRYRGFSDSQVWQLFESDK